MSRGVGDLLGRGVGDRMSGGVGDLLGRRVGDRMSRGVGDLLGRGVEHLIVDLLVGGVGNLIMMVKRVGFLPAASTPTIISATLIYSTKEKIRH